MEGIEIKNLNFRGVGALESVSTGILFWTGLSTPSKLLHIVIDQVGVTGFGSGESRPLPPPL